MSRAEVALPPLAYEQLQLVSVPDHKETEMANPAKPKKTKTAGVYRRGDRYLYTYRVDGRQRWGTASSLDDARRAKRQAEADADRGELVDTGRICFGDYAHDWIAGYQGRTSRGIRNSTKRFYRTMLEQRVIHYFDARRTMLCDIGPRDVKAFVRWVADQDNPRRRGQLLSKSSVRHHVAVLRALLGDAFEEGLIRSNPAAGVRVSVPEGDGTRRLPAQEKQAMTLEELRSLMTEIPDDWRLFFELLLQAGLRIGEAIELRVGRDLVLGDRPHLKIRFQFADGSVCEPKTRYGKRDIPLSAQLASKLAAYTERHVDGQLLFTTSRGGRHNRHNLYRDVLGPACRRAGVPWVTLHTFRHTCASLLFASPEHGGGGKNVKQVQEWLGHHSPAYTLREYVHLIDEGLGDAAFFDAALATSRTTEHPLQHHDTVLPS